MAYTAAHYQGGSKCSISPIQSMVNTYGIMCDLIVLIEKLSSHIATYLNKHKIQQQRWLLRQMNMC